MKEKSFSQRLPVLLAVLFTMTMIMSVMYVPVSAAETEYTVSGIWIFDTGLYPGFDSRLKQMVSFTSNDKNYVALEFDTTVCRYYVSEYSPVSPWSQNAGWGDDVYSVIDFGEDPQTVTADFYNRLTQLATPYIPPDPTAILSGTLDVFSIIGTWLVTSVSSLILLFYSAETGLTFVGVLAVAGLAISVVLLLVALISRWLKFK